MHGKSANKPTESDICRREQSAAKHSYYNRKIGLLFFRDRNTDALRGSRLTWIPFIELDLVGKEESIFEASMNKLTTEIVPIGAT